MVRMRTRVVAGAAAALVAVAVVVALAAGLISSSDAATTSLRTAQRAVEVEPAELGTTLRERWTATTTGAQPTTVPADHGTVVVGGTDRVAGLDATTGQEIWSYVRGNATLCGWTQTDGVVVALFKKSHGCRQAVALDAALGTRKWYRTLEIPVDAVLSGGPGVAVATTAGQLVAVDTATGLNRWTYRGPEGCTLDPAVAGRVAVIAVARCADGSVKLVGHDTYAEKTSWTVDPPAGGVPVVLGGEENAAVLTGSTLTTYDGAGKVLGRVTDRRLARSGDVATGTVAGGTLLVWTGAAVTAVEARTRAVLWSSPATAPPTLDNDRVVLLSGTAVTTVSATTGVETARSTGPVPAGATLARVGSLVIAARRDRVVAYG